MKSIPRMLAELPEKPLYSPDRLTSSILDWRASYLRYKAEIAVLKAAAEKRQHYGHGWACKPLEPCTCGFDDLRKVLEVLK